MKCREFNLRWVLGVLVTTLVAASMCQSAHTDDAVTPQHVVKAAYLRNFAKLVTWPAKAFEHASSPLVIGVLGQDPFEQVLDKAVEARTAHKRELRVRRMAVVDGKLPPKGSLSDCHLLFVSASVSDQLPQIFERLAGTHVMTVSDVENFADIGGVIEFVLDGPNIEFRFNRQVAKAAGLRPSARLLKAAIAVPTGN